MQDAQVHSSPPPWTAAGVERALRVATVREAASAPRLLGWHAGTLLDPRTARRAASIQRVAAVYVGNTAPDVEPTLA